MNVLFYFLDARIYFFSLYCLYFSSFFWMFLFPTTFLQQTCENLYHVNSVVQAQCYLDVQWWYQEWGRFNQVLGRF